MRILTRIPSAIRVEATLRVEEAITMVKDSSKIALSISSELSPLRR
jgi:hypothetical protein